MICFNVMITLLLALSFVLVHLFASTTQGRMLLNEVDVNSSTKSHKMTKEEKGMVRERKVGSSPPRCQGRCVSCGGHCVAVQVPSSVSNLEYARGEMSSDYKPITWKCKCGRLLFNP